MKISGELIIKLDEEQVETILKVLEMDITKINRRISRVVKRIADVEQEIAKNDRSN